MNYLAKRPEYVKQFERVAEGERSEYAMHLKHLSDSINRNMPAGPLRENANISWQELCMTIETGVQAKLDARLKTIPEDEEGFRDFLKKLHG